MGMADQGEESRDTPPPQIPIEDGSAGVIRRRQLQIRAGVGRLSTGAVGVGFWITAVPELLMQAVIVPGSETSEGTLIEAVAIPWFKIIELIGRDPKAIYELSARKWEELIAGAYEVAGFDEVVLTPHSGDGGKDIIATKHGVGSIRIVDQVKRYKPGHVVTAQEVRAMLGTLDHGQGPAASKAVVTTTSKFAPGVYKEMARLIPFRLELRPRDVLLPWLDELARRKSVAP